MRQYTHFPLKEVNYLQKEDTAHPLFPTFPHHNSKKTIFKLSKSKSTVGRANRVRIHCFKEKGSPSQYTGCIPDYNNNSLDTLARQIQQCQPNKQSNRYMNKQMWIFLKPPTLRIMYKIIDASLARFSICRGFRTLSSAVFKASSHSYSVEKN